MLIAIEPMPAPRQVRSDKWRPREVVLRYRAFCDELRLKVRVGLKRFPSAVRLSFVLAMPASWPKWKREAMTGKPHMQKPDIDNLTKAVLDALLEDDACVWRTDASKVWGDAGSIEITEIINRF